MALVQHTTLSNEEKIYVSEVDSFLLPGQALSAQLCKFATQVLFDISNAILARSQIPKTSFGVGDMVTAFIDSSWGRAEILKVHEDKCLLDFVDFGAIKEYPKKSIFQLDPDICTKWDRVAIHVLLKNDMQITINAETVLSCIDTLDIDGVRYYHGNLSSFSAITGASKIHPLRSYIPVALPPTEKTVASEAAVVVNGHTENPKPVVELKQPELNEIERAFISSPSATDGWYCVQLSRFDVSALEKDLDTFYSDPNNRKTATNVRKGGYFVAPYGNQFSRAFVYDVDEAGNATIVYIDYGEETSVPVKDLLELSPGRITEHPCAMVTIETGDDINAEEEFTMRIISSYKDPYGLPVYRVKICSGESPVQGDVAPSGGDVAPTNGNSALSGGDVAASGETKEPIKPSFPPAKFNKEEQQLYICQLEGKYLAAQLGQYTVEELESLNENLTNTIQKDALKAIPDSVAAGDLVAVREETDGVVAFYRGVVAKVEDRIVWVYQVDFGYLVQSTLESVRSLPAEFISHPQIGIRCELTEAQLIEDLSEAIVVKNLRKKTHLDFIDIYEFGVANAGGETSVAESTEPRTSTSEAVRAQMEANGIGEPAQAESTDPNAVNSANKESEDAVEKALQVKDENHNYTHTSDLANVKSSQVPNGSHFVVADQESVSTSQVSEAACSRTPIEVNLAQVIAAPPKVEEMAPKVKETAPKVGATIPNGYEAAVEKFTYEFASRIEYPEFSSGFENVFVSQKTNTDMMVMLSRFGLDYLQAIDLEIKSFLEKHPHIEPTPLEVGDLVILIREDYYRRAEIVKKISDEYCVTCIDYGCVFTVPKTQLIRLPKSFEKYPRCAVHVEGAFSFTLGQKVDLILSMENGKVCAKTRQTVSPASVANDRSCSESVRSSSVSVHSDNAEDDDLTCVRDPEDPCPDKSFDVMVTAVHQATKVCVVRNQSLSLAKNVGEALKNMAQDLQPVNHERLAMGSVVAAKLNTDPPRFRRAKIAHYNRATEMYKLFLVDSGLMVKFPLSSLFILPKQFSLDRTPGYATILRLKADELAFDSKVVSEIFKGTLRCSLSYPHPDESLPGELCYEATLRNSSGNVVKQLNMKGIVSTRTDSFPLNPILLPCPAESEYLDAIVVSARKNEASSFDLTLLLVELKERLDRVVVDQNELKNLYAMKLGTPALAFIENDPTPWKRARVIGRPLPGQYKLLLVDVGIEITHPVLKTYKCPNNLLHIPEAAVEISIQSQRALALKDLQDRLVVAKSTWKIDYTTKMPTVELYDHEGNSILP